MGSNGRHADHVRGKIDAFNRGDAAGYAAHYAEDATIFDPFFPEPLVGRDGIRETTVAVRTAFPNMQWKTVTILEDGDRVATELHVEAVHEGPLATPEGEIPPTGRTVAFDLAEVMTFDDKGLIAENRSYFDPGVMMTQLGLVGE